MPVQLGEGKVDFLEKGYGEVVGPLLHSNTHTQKKQEGQLARQGRGGGGGRGKDGTLGVKSLTSVSSLTTPIASLVDILHPSTFSIG